MNKVFNINIGGYPFTIDDDAYEHLKRYMDALHNHFRTYQGADEIIEDIESRMAELFNSRLENRQIITINDVQGAIARMGTPEDFGADSVFEEESTFAKSSQRTTYQYKTGKRLYANPDDKIIAGVCSGLSAYLGIHDPVWVRIAFAVFGFMTVGTLVAVYIILMVILPKAETASQKLEMRGEPIDVNSIAKAVEDGIGNISNTITQLTDELTKKKKQR
jgi:phage shock protein PspC (stress-responsive transcriptional regulator)